VLIATCLLLEFTNCYSVKSLASGVPATTLRAVPKKSKLLATLWSTPRASYRSLRWDASTLRSFDCGNISHSFIVSFTILSYSEMLAVCLTKLNYSQTRT